MFNSKSGEDVDSMSWIVLLCLLCFLHKSYKCRVLQAQGFIDKNILKNFHLQKILGAFVFVQS